MSIEDKSKATILAQLRIATSMNGTQELRIAELESLARELLDIVNTTANTRYPAYAPVVQRATAMLGPGKSTALASSESTDDKFTGWVYGNNYKQRGKPTNSTGAVHNEPWYITADGKLWSAFDVTFRPDEAGPEKSAEGQG